MDVTELRFEEAIEASLLGHNGAGLGVAETPATYGDFAPGGYRKRRPEDYDRALCLDAEVLLDFVYATQPKEWAKLQQHHGGEARAAFLKRVAHEVGKRGTLHVLRQGVRDSGCRFRLAYFRPASGLNPELQRLHLGNQFSLIRQLRYSEAGEQSLDMVLFLNGLPLFTTELKNPLTGQNVQHAMQQYSQARNPREPLFAFRRCLAHFAIDPDLVYMTTHLLGRETRFLPFNRGRDGGAGNPPSRSGYATAYLWEGVWSRDSILDLVENFIQDVEELDERGAGTGKHSLIFPRYHQLDAVRRLVASCQREGAGEHYLVQHSAGSGKSNTIAWLAYQLSVLHGADDRRVFDSIIVVSDRRVIDRQLQRTLRQFQQTEGVLENIDQTSRQLRQALAQGKTIIVTTLQKFPVVLEQLVGLEQTAEPEGRFAVVVDEAHSSQSGEAATDLRKVLAGAEREDGEEEGEQPDLEDVVNASMRARGRQPNTSFFAFTATPKPETLQIFGCPQADGSYEPFSLYSMRQAIEEHFILDVLENYTTYKAYWSLLKRIEDDPRYEVGKARYLLKEFVDLHEHAIAEKVKVIVEHFADRVQERIGGKAKAMIVTRSRKHAVRYRLAVDAYLAAQGYPFRALVAFTAAVEDGGETYTEAGMNGFPEAQTAAAFERDENRFLIVAEKFQTGFDQPLLHTMYVDKRLTGVHAVQTLSRLNRMHPGKTETMVLDFANEAEAIQQAFEPYYDRTVLAEATDPNRLYDLQSDLGGYRFYTDEDLDRFARVYFDLDGSLGRLYAALEPVRQRYEQADEADRTTFRGYLREYVRLYAFLSQVIRFVDADLEKLYVFSRLLLRRLPAKREDLPLEIQQNVDMESYRLVHTATGTIELARGKRRLPPVEPRQPELPGAEELEPLSLIIRELNERFGTSFTEADRVTIQQLEEQLLANEALAASVRVNTPDNARLTFDHVVTDRFQDLVDSNFRFYKQVTDDAEFSKALLDWLFARYRKRTGRTPA
ncbi:MAG: type I restriction endonuclease subunit R [Anaerolineae bacterium]